MGALHPASYSGSASLRSTSFAARASQVMLACLAVLVEFRPVRPTGIVFVSDIYSALLPQSLFSRLMSNVDECFLRFLRHPRQARSVTPVAEASHRCRVEACGMNSTRGAVPFSKAS
mmetsp:Transcript_4468/g.16022  ORF Transcript_4468/g.16022 Transcript_4468/m.16022 type:complete len:117 (-) Transcript_4468:2018-2368(-)